MKKTINVNIGSYGFVVDEDAYQLLSVYLSDIRSRLDSSDGEEIVADVEIRIADLFREQLNHNGQVVGTGMVRKAITVIGRADDFGERKHTPKDNSSTSPKKLYRARKERVIGGVCGGLAKYFDIDPVVIRVIAIILLILGLASLWIYIILWIIVPQEPMQLNYFNETRKK